MAMAVELSENCLRARCQVGTWMEEYCSRFGRSGGCSEPHMRRGRISGGRRSAEAAHTPGRQRWGSASAQYGSFRPKCLASEHSLGQTERGPKCDRHRCSALLCCWTWFGHPFRPKQFLVEWRSRRLAILSCRFPVFRRRETAGGPLGMETDRENESINSANVSHGAAGKWKPCRLPLLAFQQLGVFPEGSRPLGSLVSKTLATVLEGRYVGDTLRYVFPRNRVGAGFAGGWLFG